jgi:hypothetical protein
VVVVLGKVLLVVAGLEAVETEVPLMAKMEL